MIAETCFSLAAPVLLGSFRWRRIDARRTKVASSFRRAASLSLLALALAQPVWAAPTDASPAAIAVSTCPSNPNEQADQRIAQDAEHAFNSAPNAPYDALQPHLPALRDVMHHAPACFPELELRSSQILVRTDDMAKYLVLSALVATGGTQPAYDSVMAPNTYLLVALLLASEANEHGRSSEALDWANRGLALQPHDQDLSLEKVAALQQLGRHDEAFAVLESVLGDPVEQLTLDQSRFLRNKGIILIDLNRIDEAEAALNESIRLEPNNPGARRELQYIQQLRAGHPPSGVTLTRPYAQPQTPNQQ
jgi:tetratricopeptide (TPR) repeat protein